MDASALSRAVRESVSAGEATGSTLRLVRQFIMDIERSDDPASLFSTPPPATGDPHWDAMIAGVVEDFALRHGISAPNWTFEPSRYLPTWWFLTGIDAMRPTAIVESPASLSGRGVFVQRASLINV